MIVRDGLGRVVEVNVIADAKVRERDDKKRHDVLSDGEHDGLDRVHFIDERRTHRVAVGACPNAKIDQLH